MTNKSLPTRLGREPLVDVVFEVRFSSKSPLSNILPGYFFQNFKDEITLEQLPHSQLPQAIRESAPDLKFAPLLKMQTKDYSYLISDSSVAISSNLPYQGWQHFKAAILYLLKILDSISLLGQVERFSLKYIDLLEQDQSEDHSRLLGLSILLGDNSVSNKPYQVRLEIAGSNNDVALLQIISSANVATPGSDQRTGIVIDIDTIRNIEPSELKNQLDIIQNNLDEIHAWNKQLFFMTLSEDGLKTLEPVYE